MILGIGYSLRFNCSFRFLNSLINRIQFDLSIGYAKDWDPYSESLATSRTPSVYSNRLYLQLRWPLTSIQVHFFSLCMYKTYCRIHKKHQFCTNDSAALMEFKNLKTRFNYNRFATKDHL